MPKEGKSYKQLKEELDTVVSELQKDDLDVEQALKLYETGQGLIRDLEDYLQNAENKVIALKAKFDK
ncbi:MAG TPA: exodeoxyribonuclease VII small subunit [Candidatus Saccharimonadales bacterium]|nr:exodeoxyribonuclease VII small subunit [Candidatus Saccharimonadales bacterium]